MMQLASVCFCPYFALQLASVPNYQRNFLFHSQEQIYIQLVYVRIVIRSHGSTENYFLEHNYEKINSYYVLDLGCKWIMHKVLDHLSNLE